MRLNSCIKDCFQFPYLFSGRKSEVTLQFLFFDGEEAFKTWSSTDSLYGSRHLATKWSRTPYSYKGVAGNQLDRIDVFMLLDLLGAANPKVTSSHTSTEVHK